MFPRPIEHRPLWSRLGYKWSLPVVLTLWLLPLLAVLLTSVRTVADLQAGNYWGWPTSIHFIENYTAIFKNTPIGTYLLNSLKITIPTVALTLILSCMTGYALAIYRFRFSVILFFIFIAGNFVPYQILMVPVRDFSVRTGLYDTITGLVLFHAAFQTGFCTLFMRNFIRALPRALIESARVEGVSELKIFWYIVMPLMRPAIAALAVLLFTFVWNDFFWATVLVQGTHSLPITAGLSSLNGQWVAQWHLVSAGSIVAALPPVLMFFLMQRHFIAGLTLGAVK